MFARVLVPVDSEAASDAALECARMFARTFGGTLNVIHVRRRPAQAGSGPGGHVHIIEGSDPALDIVEHAQAIDADLIVMGTHGRSGISHLLRGSVAESVVRTSHCPVLTLRSPARMPSVRRILVPTDFSAPSDAALESARLSAMRFAGSVHLLHVIDVEQIERQFGFGVSVGEAPQARAARLRDARERLAHRVTAREREQARVTTEVVSGDAARSIVQYARRNTFDLVVMGTHGRTGLAHFMLGSVAEQVVRRAGCAVITTHDAGSLKDERLKLRDQSLSRPPSPASDPSSPGHEGRRRHTGG